MIYKYPKFEIKISIIRVSVIHKYYISVAIFSNFLENKNGIFPRENISFRRGNMHHDAPKLVQITSRYSTNYVIFRRQKAKMANLMNVIILYKLT